MGCGASSKKEFQVRLDTVEARCEELKGCTDDASLDSQKSNAQELNAVFLILVQERGGKDAEELCRVQRLSDAILSYLESRVTVALLDRADFATVKATLLETAKSLDSVRATKASEVIEDKLEGLQDKKGLEELKQVSQCVSALKTAADMGEGLPKAIDAADVAFQAAPGSTKMAKNLLALMQQLCQHSQTFVPQLLAADPAAVGKVLEAAQRLDDLALKLVVIVESKWDPPLAPSLDTTVKSKA
jgi:hypothetical protein